VCPQETEAPAKRSSKARVQLSPVLMARVFAVMTAASVTSSLLYFTTNGNAQLLGERFRGIVEDPALLGMMLAAVYAVASLSQVVMGRLIDRVPLKPLYLGIALAQVPLLALVGRRLVDAGLAAGGDGVDLRFDPLDRRLHCAGGAGTAARGRLIPATPARRSTRWPPDLPAAPARCCPTWHTGRAARWPNT
jgi:MFS family permease